MGLGLGNSQVAPITEIINHSNHQGRRLSSSQCHLQLYSSSDMSPLRCQLMQTMMNGRWNVLRITRNIASRIISVSDESIISIRGSGSIMDLMPSRQIIEKGTALLLCLRDKMNAEYRYRVDQESEMMQCSASHWLRPEGGKILASLSFLISYIYHDSVYR